MLKSTSEVESYDLKSIQIECLCLQNGLKFIEICFFFILIKSQIELIVAFDFVSDLANRY